MKLLHRKHFSVVIFLLGCSFCMSLQAQEIAISDNGEMKLAALAIPDPASKQYILNIYYRAPYGMLKFVKKDTLYVTRYQLSISLSEAKSQFHKTETVTNEIKVSTFTETKSLEKEIFHLVKFTVPAHKYLMDVQLEDLETSYSNSEQHTVEVPDYQKDKIGISNPLFVNKPFVENEVPSFYSSDRTIVANFDSGFYVHVEVYQQDPHPAAQIQWSFLRDGRTLVTQNHQEIQSNKTILPLTIPVTSDKLPPGKYVIDFSIESGISKGNKKINVSILWRNRPIGALDLEKAVVQMEYMLPKTQYDILISKKGEEQRAYFMELWKANDPTPATPENELVEEYYFRVDYANLNFSTVSAEGWRTDRGRIYILLGPPDRINRHYREFDTPPYELWIYNNLNRKYYFSDKNNTGDFKLVSISEE